MIFLMFFPKISYSQSNNSISRQFNQFLNKSENISSAISFGVYDLTKDSLIFGHNLMMAVSPASTMKLFTTALAYEKLGSHYTVNTKLMYDGDIDSNGILNGNLWIIGAGDPTLGSKYFEKKDEQALFLNEWVNIIQSFGIKAINGNIIGDASNFDYLGAPEGWNYGDLGNYYGAGPSGLTVFDNLLNLYFNVPSEQNEPATISCMAPYIPGLEHITNVTAAPIKYDNTYIFGAPFGLDRHAIGSLPRNSEDFIVKSSIPDPELLIAQELTVILNESIPVSGIPLNIRKHQELKQTNKSLKLIHEHPSKTVHSIAYWTNMRSVNLYAEHLLNMVESKQRGTASTRTANSLSENFWRNIVGNGITINDGSGLSRKNGASAEHFCRMLIHVSKQKYYDDFIQTLPVAGKSGTLSSICRNQAAQGRIKAKSGTMSKIKSYAGYVETKNKQQLVFSISINNHQFNSTQLKKEIELIFNSMVNL